MTSVVWGLWIRVFRREGNLRSLTVVIVAIMLPLVRRISYHFTPPFYMLHDEICTNRASSMLDASSSAVLDEICTLCEADIFNTRGTRSFRCSDSVRPRNLHSESANCPTCWRTKNCTTREGQGAKKTTRECKQTRGRSHDIPFGELKVLNIS